MTACAHKVCKSCVHKAVSIKANSCSILAELRIGVEALVELKVPADHSSSCFIAVL